ncbi:MAG: hypothetical protein U0795_07100 [Pirellulales bacterium]
MGDQLMVAPHGGLEWLSHETNELIPFCQDFEAVLYRLATGQNLGIGPTAQLPKTSPAVLAEPPEDPVADANELAKHLAEQLRQALDDGVQLTLHDLAPTLSPAQLQMLRREIMVGSKTQISLLLQRPNRLKIHLYVFRAATTLMHPYELQVESCSSDQQKEQLVRQAVERFRDQTSIAVDWARDHFESWIHDELGLLFKLVRKEGKSTVEYGIRTAPTVGFPDFFVFEPTDRR